MSAYERRLTQLERNGGGGWDLAKIIMWCDGKIPGAPSGPPVGTLARQLAAATPKEKE